MKIFFTLLGLLSLGLNIQTQITFEKQNYTLQVDSLFKGWTISVSGLELPDEGVNVTWHLIGQDGLGQANYAKNPAGNPMFPQANVTDNTTQSTLNGTVQILTSFFQVLDDAGYRVIDRYIATVLTRFNHAAATRLS